MLKSVVYLIFTLSLFYSCRRNNASLTAQNICNCYDSIHDESVRSESEQELDKKVKACSLMLTSTLDSFGKDEKKKADFMKSFRACQEK